jgi:hypothetical protein
MSARSAWQEALLPWAGLIAGASGWAASHQITSNAVQENCRLAGPLLFGGSGLLAAAIAVAGGWLSLGVWRSTPAGEAAIGKGTRKFIAGVGAMAAAIFLGAIVLQTIAGFIIPACHR